VGGHHCTISTLLNFITSFVDLVTCSLVVRYKRFIGTCFLHLQDIRGRRFSRGSQSKVNNNSCSMGVAICVQIAGHIHAKRFSGYLTSCFSSRGYVASSDMGGFS
jgi:hypothetical protein